MPYAVCRLLAAGLVLLTGCASPIFSGISRHLSPNSSTAGERGFAESAPQGPSRSPQNADRTSTETRTAILSTPVSEQRITELLASAAFSQRARMLSDARSKYEQVLRIDPKNMTANYQLAVIADDEGRFADARQYYFALLRQSPHNPDVLASLGWSYLLQGRYDECESALKDALHYSPAHQTALYNLGWLYGTRGDYEYALALFRKAGTEAEAQRALAELQQATPPAQPPAIEGYQNSQVAIRERTTSQTISAPAPWNADPRVSGSRERTGTSGMFSEVDAVASSSPTQANRTQTIQYEQSSRLPADQHHAVITPGASRSGVSGPRSGNAVWTTGNSQAAPGSRPKVNTPADWQRNVPANSAGPPEWSDSTLPDRSEAVAEFTSMPRAEQASRPDAWAAAAQLGLGAGQPWPVVPSSPQTAGAPLPTGRPSLSPPMPTDVFSSGQADSDRALNQPVAPAIYSGVPSPTAAR